MSLTRRPRPTDRTTLAVRAFGRVLRHGGPYLFLAGAGVSVASGLPLAREVVCDVLDEIGRGLPAPLRARLKRLATSAGPQGLRWIRFETLVQQLRDHVDPRLAILSSLVLGAEPTSGHGVLALAARAGHLVCTTNFDGLIERAGEALGAPLATVCRNSDFSRWIDRPRSQPAVIAIHGAFERHDGTTASDAAGSIQAALNDIGRQGLAFVRAPAKRRFLERALATHDVVVLGYSGTDDFDVSAVLREASMRRVVWVDHAAREDEAGVFPLRDETIAGRVPRALRDLLREMCSHGDPHDPGVLVRLPTQAALAVVARVVLGIDPPRLAPFVEPTARRRSIRKKIDAWHGMHLRDRWNNYHLAGELFMDAMWTREAAACARLSSRHAADRDQAACLGSLATAALWADDRYAAAIAASRRVLSMIGASAQASSMPPRRMRMVARLVHLRFECTFLCETPRRAHAVGVRSLKTLDRLCRAADPSVRGLIESSRVDVLCTLGNVEIALGRIDAARDLFREALAASHRTGVFAAQAYAESALADTLRLRRRYGRARAGYRRAEFVSVAGGDLWLVGWCKVCRAILDRRDPKPRGMHADHWRSEGERRWQEARGELRQAIGIFERLGDGLEKSNALMELGHLYRLRGTGRDLGVAARLYGQARRLGERASYDARVAEIDLATADIERLRGDPAAARRRAARVLRRARRTGLRVVAGNAWLLLFAIDRDRRALTAARRSFAASASASGLVLAGRLDTLLRSAPDASLSALDFAELA